jgi:Leucine-rich repeat (LRR) protein
MEGTSEFKVLNLKRNRLHGELPHINKNASCSFEVLDFGDNELEGKLPRSLAACENLQVLDIQNNQISDSFPCWLSTLGRLQVLVLKSNDFFGQVGPCAAQYKNSCEFPSIQILDLASNYFSGTLAREWLTKLKSMMVKFDDETRVYDGDVDPQQYEPETELTYKGSDLTIEKVLMRNLAFLDVSNSNFQGKHSCSYWGNLFC